jgi:serine protease Do
MEIMKIRYTVAVLIVAGTILFFAGMLFHTEQGNARESSQVDTVVIRDETGFTKAISTVSQTMMPAVVHIDVTGTVVQRLSDYRDFFSPLPQREIPIQALGSGVLINSDGYIITNNHVVQNADSIEVELYDGSRHTAKLIGTDPNTDLAVVKIELTPEMKYAKFGDSDAIEVGEWVIAIGSPRGLDWTVTAGIISAKNRRDIGALGPTGYEDFIQTDASVNPGNSGGPLINLEGEVIGINSLIVSASRGSDGLSFAIPSNMVKTISESLIKHGKVVRGYLGINIQDVTPDMVKSLKLNNGFKGAIVADVLTNGPAARAGLEQGDIVLSYNGETVESSAQLRNMVAITKPGTQVRVKIRRDKKEIELTAEIGDLEKGRKQAKANTENDLLGLNIERVTPEIARSAGFSKVTGVIVTDIKRGGPAARIGLSEGDIILRAGNNEINTPEQFNSYVARAAEEGSVLLLIRDQESRRIGYLTIPIPIG